MQAGGADVSDDLFDVGKSIRDTFVRQLTTPPPRPSEMNGRELTDYEKMALAVAFGAHLDFECDGRQLRATTREIIGVVADPYADKWIVAIRV